YYYKMYTQIHKCIIFYSFFTAGRFADKIGPMDEANIVGKETDTVTLKYLYESSSSNILLSWYIQYPNSALHFLFNVGDSPTDIRLEAESTSDSTELTIRYLKPSDSARY
ncbi:hypothetical protein C0J45_24411, partial [Silurus meridionalis]